MHAPSEDAPSENELTLGLDLVLGPEPARIQETAPPLGFPELPVLSNELAPSVAAQPLELSFTEAAPASPWPSSPTSAPPPPPPAPPPAQASAMARALLGASVPPAWTQPREPLGEDRPMPDEPLRAEFAADALSPPDASDEGLAGGVGSQGFDDSRAFEGAAADAAEGHEARADDGLGSGEVLAGKHAWRSRNPRILPVAAAALLLLGGAYGDCAGGSWCGQATRHAEG